MTLTNDSTLPVTITGRQLTGITYELPVASAQVKSAIMLAGMLADGVTIIHEPTPTRDHTEKMFEDFQIDYNKVNQSDYVHGSQRPITPERVIFPG